MSLEKHFDATFATRLALKEKQIQQNYRPVIGVHKWFARRPGTIFRCMLLAEFNGQENLDTSYWRSHRFQGVIADPFMGGGSPIFEANRLGFSVVGADINPMAYWVVRQSLAALDIDEFTRTAATVAADIEKEIGKLYKTKCVDCGKSAEVKYFLWVKTSACPSCGQMNDLFPGYLLAEAVRHPYHVVVCPNCGHLNELEVPPSPSQPARCCECASPLDFKSQVNHQQAHCRGCGCRFPYVKAISHPPKHRMWAIEYHCASCKPHHKGRFFKKPDRNDLALISETGGLLAANPDLPLPEDKIPSGDETDRLHRWGYCKYQEMFNERQLLGLGLLLRRILMVDATEIRHALLTVFSDFLRYQNMLCRYDTYALKCQDIFSVHGFPVGLVQCENNLLGIPRVGSGSFRHFVEKYIRAKRYCEAPFETKQNGGKKYLIHIEGETIRACLVNRFPAAGSGQARLLAASATDMPLPPESLDGVFTDPPYFDNVQYAELMDFCYAWLRLALQNDVKEFRADSTRSKQELTGNVTLGRGLEHFTQGLSAIFRHYARALKPNAPFVFTYHHNDPTAYLPIVVAVLDSGLDCTATLPAAAEMTASLHIARTGSSVLDSVFICRNRSDWEKSKRKNLGDISSALQHALQRDAETMAAAGLRLSNGDLRCLAAGHMARFAITSLRPTWDADITPELKLARAREGVEMLLDLVDLDVLIRKFLITQPWAVAVGTD